MTISQSFVSHFWHSILGGARLRDEKITLLCRKQSKSFYSPCQGCQLPQWTDFRSCYMKSLQEPKFLWVSSKLGTYRAWWIVFTIPGPHFLVFPRNTPFFFFFNSKGRCLFRVYYEPLTSNNANCEVQACLWKSGLVDKGVNASLRSRLGTAAEVFKCGLFALETRQPQYVKRKRELVFPGFYECLPCAFECSWWNSVNYWSLALVPNSTEKIVFVSKE